MCVKCWDAVEQVLQGVNDDARSFIIWNETAYPFCDAEMFKKQLMEYMNITIEATP